MAPHGLIDAAPSCFRDNPVHADVEGLLLNVLDQPILQHLVRSFHLPLRLGCQRVDRFDGKPHRTDNRREMPGRDLARDTRALPLARGIV